MRLASILALAALTLAAPALAESNPAKVRLTAQSGKGAILIRVPVQPFTCALQFSKDGKSGFLSRVYLMKVKPGAAKDHEGDLRHLEHRQGDQDLRLAGRGVSLTAHNRSG